MQRRRHAAVLEAGLEQRKEMIAIATPANRR
jgi:hypothetical protein